MERRSLMIGLFSLILLSTVIFTQNLQSKTNDSQQDQAEISANPQDESTDPQSRDSQDKTASESTDESSSLADSDEESAANPSRAELKSNDDNGPTLKPQYAQLGSLSEKDPTPFLAVFNRKGATLTSVELNARKSDKKKFRYRQLNHTSGYLGFLAMTETLQGCVINFVGNGTPAAVAKAGAETGLKPGDRILKINGNPIANRVEFDLQLNERECRPGNELTITVSRAGKTLQFKTKLIERPLALTHPEPHPSGVGNPADPESYRISVRKPGLLNADWVHLDASLLDGMWDIESESETEVVFKKTISAEKLSREEIGYGGEMIVRKIFRLPAVQAEEGEEFARNYHIDFDIKIERIGGSEEDEFSLQVNGPTGLTLEGWWYTNKIHGSATAIMTAAGTRDVIVKSVGGQYQFYGSSQIYKLARKESKGKKSPYKISVLSSESPDEERSIKFAGVDTIYFANVLIPKSDVPFFAENIYVAPENVVSKATDKFQKKTDVSFRAYSRKFSINPGEEKLIQSFEIFVGPKDSDLLPKYELSELQAYGWFAFLSKLLLSVLHFFYWILGNYGIAIILLTVMVRCAMMPISRKAALNAQMMQFLAPEMKKIADKYKDDMEKRGQAQRALFKRYNYNPFGGCLLMFFQLPIFIGLYRGLSVDMALRDQPLIPGLQWCSNLAAPDQLLYWEKLLPISWLTSETGFLGPYLNILPLITIVLFLIQQKLFTPPPTDEQQAMTQKMMSFMMLFFGILFFKVPSGLCIYFITSSIWGIAERKLLPKPELDKGKLESIGSDDESSKPAKPKARPNDGTLFGIKIPGQPEKKQSLSGEERKQRDKEREKRRNEKRRSK